MANVSPSPIDSITQCLAKAAEAARSLDSAASEDLRALLRIAACEAGRLGKAKPKLAAAAKPAAKAAAKPAKKPKATSPIEAKASPKQPKIRRKAGLANGVAAH